MTVASLPFFAAVAPPVLLGQPFRPWRNVVRRLALNGLPRDEQDRIADGLVAESGRVYRDLLLGRAHVPRRAITAPMLVMHGRDDRLIPAHVARGIADNHRAEFLSIADCGHWLIAPSRLPSAGAEALSWIGERLEVGNVRSQLR